MTDRQLHALANNEDLRERLEVRIATFANYNIDANNSLKPKAKEALLNAAGEVEKVIWYAVLNVDLQHHYDGTIPLVEGDKDTPGTLTYVINFVVESKCNILWT